MVGIGGEVKPYIGNPIFQQNKSGFSVDVTIAPIITSGHANGVGGALVSGNICHTETGFVEFRFSGQKIWIPYWVSS